MSAGSPSRISAGSPSLTESPNEGTVGSVSKELAPNAKAILRFGSRYIFHRPEDLIQKFLSEDVDCVYKDDQFILTYPFHIREATCREFGAAWQNYIKAALQNNTDALEGPLISEKSLFQAIQWAWDWDPNAYYLEHSPETQGRVDRLQHEAELAEPPPFLLVEHEALSRDFYRKGLSKTTLAELYSARILRDIQNLTSCHLELNENAGNITIKGDSEEMIDRAVAKLDNLENIHAVQLSRSWKSNFYITNHVGMYRFCLLQDDLLIDRALSRTKLTYARILKFPWVPALRKHQVQIFRRQAIVYDWETSRFWLDYAYPAYGKVENSPANWPSGSAASTMAGSISSHPLLAPKKLDTVRKWVPEASNTQEDPFQPKRMEEYDDREKPALNPQHHRITRHVPEDQQIERAATSERVQAEQGHDSIIVPESQVVAPEVVKQDTPKLRVPHVNEAWPSPEMAMAWDSPLNVEERKRQKEAEARESQVPYVDERYPSPETAMAWDSPLNIAVRKQQREEKARKAKAQAALPVTKRLIPTPTVAPTVPSPTSPPAEPVGPVARLAALHMAKMSPRVKPPPPIEDPYMPISSVNPPDMGSRSSRRQPPKIPDRSTRNQSQLESADRALSAVSEASQQLYVLPFESSPDTTRELTTVIRPRSRLNPRAPSFEPSKPLQSPLLPTLTSQKPKAQEGLLINLIAEKESTKIQSSPQKGKVATFDGVADFSDGSYSFKRQNPSQIYMPTNFDGTVNLSSEDVSVKGQLPSQKRMETIFDGMTDLSSKDDSVKEQNSLQHSSMDPFAGIFGSPLSAAPLKPQTGPTHQENLIDFSDDEKTMVERKEEISEAESRLFFDGSLLQAPRSQPTLLVDVDDQKAVYDDILVAIIEALDMIRAVRGQVTLKLDLGHVLVPKLPFYKFPYKDGFAPAEWKSHMDATKPWSIGKNLVFSRVLTKHWFDAEWMVDSRDAQGVRIFNEGSRQSRVFYEFKCRNKVTKAEHLITLDTDGSYEITTIPHVEAEINVLFLDHNWDAQLTARSQSEPEHLEKKYLASIIENMYIPGISKYPEIYTRHDNQFIDIISIVVKRRSSFEAASSPDFALQMTEVMDLPIQKSKHSQFYRAVGIEADLVKEDRRWYEASIISTAAQVVLTENVNLEVGEYAKWTTERVAGAGFVQDLLDITAALIANSDAVGCPTEGFLPEADPNKKVAAAQARAVHGYTSTLTASMRAPAAPQSRSVASQRHLPIAGPPGIIERTFPRFRPPVEDLITPSAGQDTSEEITYEALCAPERPPGFW